MPDQAILALPAYLAATYYNHFYTHYLVRVSKNPRAYNNVMPRNSPPAVEKALSPADWGKYQRARAAHFNGLEGFPLFAAGVLAARFAGLEIDNLAWTLVGLRMLYGLLYIHTTRMATSWIRTLVWTAATGGSIHLMIKAAYALDK